MAIISTSDFDNVPFKVPNQAESPWFEAFIEAEEVRLLKLLLGLDLYNAFIEGLATSGTPEQRWVDLRDGAEYEYGDRNYEYVGVVTMLRPAIYAAWIEEDYRKKTSSGTIINQGQENTLAVNPTYDIIKNWNLFADYVGTNIFNTFYGFMYINIDDYEVGDIEWVFTPQYRRNQLGL